MSCHQDVYLQRIQLEHTRPVSAQVDGWFESTWGAVHDPNSAEPDAVLESLMESRNLLPVPIDTPVPIFTTFPAPELVPGAVPSGRCLLLPEYRDLYRDFAAWLDPDRRAASFQPSMTDCQCSNSSGLFEVSIVGGSQFAERQYRKCFLPRAFHVYGSRGVGKSIALYYVLLRRTLLHQPTVFVTAGRTFYICEDGVFELRDLDVWEYDTTTADKDHRALLFDSVDASNPSMLWTFQRRLPILEVRSPGSGKEMWSYILNGSVVVWWYRPPCRLHAIAAAALHLDSDVNDNDLNRCAEAYTRWGPSVSEIVRVLNEEDEEDQSRTPDFTSEQLRQVLAATDKRWLLVTNFIHPIKFSNDAALLSCGATRHDVRVTLLSRYLWTVLEDSDG